MFSFNVDKREILIHDEIGPSWWGLIDADSVRSALAEMDGDILIRLNTPGGSVDEGIAIYNELTRYDRGKVTTVVDSLAASMGSYLLQAGSHRVVLGNSMVMIHDPWTITYGNSASLRKEADVLDKYAARMRPDYAARSGKTEEEITAIMLEETWYSGQEIVDAGFADEVSASAKAEFRPNIAGLHRLCKSVPQSLLDMKAENDQARIDDKLLSVGIDRKVMSVAAAKECRERALQNS